MTDLSADIAALADKTLLVLDDDAPLRTRLGRDGTVRSGTYRGARLANIRCRVRRCMLSRRAVSETLWLQSS